MMSTPAVAVLPQAVADVTYAGFWRRFAALALDGLIVCAMSLVLGGIFGDQSQLGNAVGVILGLAYYVYFFTGTGQTVGSKVMGIKVVDVNGRPLAVGPAIIRVLGAYVSGMLLGLGYLWMLRDANKQTLHDKMASSFVIKS